MSVQYKVADCSEGCNQELSCNLSTSKESQAVMVFPAKPGNTSHLFGNLCCSSSLMLTLSLGIVFLKSH